MGVDPRTMALDMEGVKAGFGVDPSTEGLTYRELRARREKIRKRLAARGRRTG
jgi:hypothetical protein